MHRVSNDCLNDSCNSLNDSCNSHLEMTVLVYWAQNTNNELLWQNQCQAQSNSGNKMSEMTKTKAGQVGRNKGANNTVLTREGTLHAVKIIPDIRRKMATRYGDKCVKWKLTVPVTCSCILGQICFTSCLPAVVSWDRSVLHPVYVQLYIGADLLYFLSTCSCILGQICFISCLPAAVSQDISALHPICICISGTHLLYVLSTCSKTEAL